MPAAELLRFLWTEGETTVVYLPWQILFYSSVASLVGIVVFVILMVVRRQDRNVPIAFGPYLAAAGWIAMIWGTQITDVYFDTFL